MNQQTDQSTESLGANEKPASAYKPEDPRDAQLRARWDRRVSVRSASATRAVRRRSRKRQRVARRANR